MICVSSVSFPWKKITYPAYSHHPLHRLDISYDADETHHALESKWEPTGPHKTKPSVHKVFVHLFADHDEKEK